MTEWKFIIRETSVFYIELETAEEDAAYNQIREMVISGEIDIARPAEYENTEFVEEV